MQMDRARYKRKAAWDYASHEGPRMDSWTHTSNQTAVRFATITLNQKAGLQRNATSRLSYVSS